MALQAAIPMVHVVKYMVVSFWGNKEVIVEFVTTNLKRMKMFYDWLIWRIIGKPLDQTSMLSNIIGSDYYGRQMTKS
jgi:hypothetical protein